MAREQFGKEQGRETPLNPQSDKTALQAGAGSGGNAHPLFAFEAA
jgi:hypothetical protein